MSVFNLQSPFEPSGDQPAAIAQLTECIRSGNRYSTLLGVTGSGKTFTMANVIRNIGVPTLVLSHNKTLAAQLYAELKTFFPDNAVHYFVSYYDYYQPEAYLPTTDTYIEKDASINDSIERLRLASTAALISREDVIIVASVSAIYGLGSPKEYEGMTVKLSVGKEYPRRDLLKSLVDIQYSRNDWDFSRGRLRVRGDVIEVYPAYSETALRLEFFDEELEGIAVIDPLSGDVIERNEVAIIFPARHFVLPEESIENSLSEIEAEMKERVAWFKERSKLIEAQRSLERTTFDLEMLSETGICPGIENYSRILANREPGSRPYVLLDYFPKGFLTIIDESHVTLPQIRGMYYGDRSRKANLVEFGFRLPSSLDNRPLKFEEFQRVTGQTVFVSATPAEFEKVNSTEIVEQIIRPTGLVDPIIEVRTASGQIDDLLRECREAEKQGSRVLITTITKRLAEDIAAFMQKQGVRCKYLHSEIRTLERVEILTELRQGKFDVLVGVNLLREGLDLPEVSLVAILDADKQGFLRNETSLIQTMGRCARNVDGKVILYADRETPAMKGAIRESSRRRKLQLEYNEEHGITPTSTTSKVKDAIREALEEVGFAAEEEERLQVIASADSLEVSEKIYVLTEAMHLASAEMRFEDAAAIRDQLAKVTGDKRFAPPSSLIQGRKRRKSSRRRTR